MLQGLQEVGKTALDMEIRAAYMHVHVQPCRLSELAALSSVDAVLTTGSRRGESGKAADSGRPGAGGQGQLGCGCEGRAGGSTARSCLAQAAAERVAIGGWWQIKPASEQNGTFNWTIYQLLQACIWTHDPPCLWLLDPSKAHPDVLHAMLARNWEQQTSHRDHTSTLQGLCAGHRTGERQIHAPFGRKQRSAVKAVGHSSTATNA